MYNLLKKFYLKGLYTQADLEKYVQHGTITEEEMNQIILEVDGGGGSLPLSSLLRVA